MLANGEAVSIAGIAGCRRNQPTGEVRRPVRPRVGQHPVHLGELEFLDRRAFPSGEPAQLLVRRTRPEEVRHTAGELETAEGVAEAGAVGAFAGRVSTR